jgi:hypothetical protein
MGERGRRDALGAGQGEGVRESTDGHREQVEQAARLLRPSGWLALGRLSTRVSPS